MRPDAMNKIILKRHSTAREAFNIQHHRKNGDTTWPRIGPPMYIRGDIAKPMDALKDAKAASFMSGCKMSVNQSRTPLQTLVEGTASVRNIVDTVPPSVTKREVQRPAFRSQSAMPAL
jgi:hypothetical protein